ncbi:MAG: DUF2330 domain-containing protein [Planctomycetota bacterium]|nr:DUF2330 domain-containing protein [Planctomycetota bacterium]
MNQRFLMSSLVALVLSVCGFLPAIACIHGPEAFKGELSAESYRGIIFHSGQREELILFTNLSFDIDHRPKNLGWVIAVPSIPDHYSTDIKPEIFDDAAKLIPVDEAERAMGPSFGGDSNELDIKVIKVGPYVIHRVTASGLKAVKSMNAWFKKNGFATKKESEMKFFIDHKYTFLCLKVDWKPIPKKKMNDDEAQALPPLRVSFKTERPFFPLKFSSHQGDFSLRLLTFTEKPIDWVKSSPVFKQLAVRQMTHLDKFAAQNYVVKQKNFKGALKKTYGDIVKEKRLNDKQEWHFNAFSVDSINSDDDALIKDWKTDFYLEIDSDPLREKVKTLLSKAIAPLKGDSGKVDKKAELALRTLGAKAVPGISQLLIRSTDSYSHVVGLEILGDHAAEISPQFIESEFIHIRDSEMEVFGTAMLRFSKILLQRHDKRGLAILLETAMTTWNYDDAKFGYKTQFALELQVKAMLEKATGLDFGHPGKVSKDLFGDIEVEWQNWWDEHKDTIQWDKKSKLFIVKKK